MAISKTALKRTFNISKNGKKLSLPDPDPSMTPEQVMTFYSNQYPELTTSSVHGPEYHGDTMSFEFKTTVGSKG